MFLDIFLRVFTIFAILLVGIIANRTKVLPNESSPYLISLLLNITTPCLTVYSLMQRKVTDSLKIESIQALVGTTVMIAVSVLLGFIVVRLFQRGKRPNNGLLVSIFTSVNCTFMGFPISQQLFGDTVFYFVVLTNVLFNVFFYGISPIMMNSGSGARENLKKAGRAFRTPIMISIYIGLFLMITQIKIPEPVTDCIGLIGDVTVPLSMLVIGVQLGSSHPKAFLKNYKMLCFSIVKMLLLPIAMIGFVCLFPFANDVKTALALNFVFPVAVATSAIAEQENSDYHLVAEIVTLTTILSLITIPIFATVIKVLFPF